MKIRQQDQAVKVDNTRYDSNAASEKKTYSKPRIVKEESVQSVSLGTGPGPLGC